MDRIEKRRQVREQDESGNIADSMEVRLAIVSQIESGEISLEEGQSRLRKIKRDAKKNGKMTRAQAWREG